MGVVIGFVWLVIGYVLMQTSIQVWAALMLPNPVERARQRIVTRPVSSFFLGLIIGVAVTAIGVNLIKIPGLGSLIGYTLMAPMFAASTIGGAAFTRILGERIKQHQRNESDMASLVGGAFLTTAAGLLPVIGWFMFLPLTGFMAIGSGTLALLSKRRVAEEAVITAPAESPGVAPSPWPAAYPVQPMAAAPAAAPQQAWSSYPTQPEQG